MPGITLTLTDSKEQALRKGWEKRLAKICHNQDESNPQKEKKANESKIQLACKVTCQLWQLLGHSVYTCTCRQKALTFLFHK